MSVTCKDCWHFTTNRDGFGRCNAPIPLWVTERSNVVSKNKPAAECETFSALESEQCADS